MRIWIPLVVTFIVVTLFALLTVLIFRHAWKTESRSRVLLQNSSLIIFSTLYVFLVLEIIFGVFVVQSDGYGFTKSSERWFQKYWNPINSDGYRDYEHVWKENVLFVVGDSFIAGHGIKHIDDRLAGVLAEKLGSSWTVAVLAQNGWNSAHEYWALVNHSKVPKKIIVSYYINDIESAAIAKGFRRPQLITMPDKMIRPFVDNSFVLNWFYWRLYRGGAGNVYWDYLKQAYHKTSIWDLHKTELSNFISYSRQNNSEIIFIVWPKLDEIDGSLYFSSRVVDYLIEQEVEVIDLATHFMGRNSMDLVVNQMDGHPNEQTNREVAELVYTALFPRN